MEPQDFSDFTVYKKQKQKRNKSNQDNNILILFISSFLIMLVLFTGIAKHMTPEVNVGVDEESNTELKESGLGVKHFIDDRLKSIQMEDRGELKNARKNDLETENIKQDEYFSPELDEKVKLPSAQTKKVSKTEKVEPQKKLEPIKYTPTSFKVVVGRYTSLDQAKVSQTIVQETMPSVTPYVKQIGGYYTLQMGVFSSKEKANNLSSELLKNHFPARIIEE